MDKYICTVKTQQGVEVVCVISSEALQQVGTLEEVTAFRETWARDFPESPLRIYKLKEVKGD